MNVYVNKNIAVNYISHSFCLFSWCFGLDLSSPTANHAKRQQSSKQGWRPAPRKGQWSCWTWWWSRVSSGLCGLSLMKAPRKVFGLGHKRTPSVIATWRATTASSWHWQSCYAFGCDLDPGHCANATCWPRSGWTFWKSESRKHCKKEKLQGMEKWKFLKGNRKKTTCGTTTWRCHATSATAQSEKEKNLLGLIVRRVYLP